MLRGKRDRIVPWVWVISWMMLIFTLSSFPDLRSGFQPLWDLVLRKLAHVFEYAILGWLLSRAFVRSGFGMTSAILWSLVIGILYAGSDEFHQSFIPGRQAAWYDILVDSIGVVLGVVLRFRTGREGKSTP